MEEKYCCRKCGKQLKSPVPFCGKHFLIELLKAVAIVFAAVLLSGGILILLRMWNIRPNALIVALVTFFPTIIAFSVAMRPFRIMDAASSRKAAGKWKKK